MTSFELRPAEPCACCDRPLNPKTVRWAVLTEGGEYYADENLPPGQVSQGWFPLGRDCYQRQVLNQQDTE